MTEWLDPESDEPLRILQRYLAEYGVPAGRRVTLLVHPSAVEVTCRLVARLPAPELVTVAASPFLVTDGMLITPTLATPVAREDTP